MVEEGLGMFYTKQNGIRLADCPKLNCRFQMRPGKIVEPDGNEMMVWYCSCGRWYWIDEDDQAEKSAWKQAYTKLA